MVHLLVFGLQITILKLFILKQVFKAGGRPSDKSQRVVDNILKYFPDFDAFPLSPPSSNAEVIQHLSDEGRQKEINSSFLDGVEDFKQMLRAKLGPKQCFGGPGLVTGQGLSAVIINMYHFSSSLNCKCFS